MVGVGIAGLKKTDPKEYRRQCREVNRDVLWTRCRERSRAESDYINGELDPNSMVGRGFISEMVVAKSLGLESGARCNCAANFGFKYDLLDSGGYGEINVKSSKLHEDERRGTWYWHFNLRNKYKPDTYIFVAYTEDYKNIEHVWIIPVDADIVIDKKGLAISNRDEGLSRVQEFEVSNVMHNVYLHTMSIDGCSVLKSPDILTGILI